MAWRHVSDAKAVNPWFLRGSPGFEIVPELTPQVLRQDNTIDMRAAGAELGIHGVDHMVWF
jgi:hypothetical protein